MDFIVGVLVGMAVMLLFGGKRMAQASDLSASLSSLAVAVNALAQAFANKPSGVDPASLDPIKQGMDDLTASVNAVLNPPTP